MKAPTATVLNVQRMSTEDGPGIRTTVFFKGCTLACSWCHNPESIESASRIVFNGERCIACGDASKTCPTGALTEDDAGVRIDVARCQICGACVDECPTEALEKLGETWSLDDLAAEVAKDRAYFARSGGGVTASGGEPAVQGPFVAAFLRHCQAEGLHTVLDTCGMCSWDTLEPLAQHSDMVLYDLKLVDSEAHARHAGAGNERVLDNLLSLGRALGEEQQLWIRTPLVPGVTATADNVREVGEFLSQHLDGRVARWELCAFNNLCQHKYDRLGLTWAFEGKPLMTRDQLDRLEEAARLAGPGNTRIQVTGAARLGACRA